MKDMNARAAAERAGYSPETAEQLAYKIMRYPLVAEAVEQAMADRRMRLRATADAAVADLFRRSRFDASVYAKVLCPADIELLTADERVPIEGWTYTQKGQFVLNLSSKTANGSTLLKHLGMLKDQVDVEHSGGINVILNAVDSAL